MASGEHDFLQGVLITIDRSTAEFTPLASLGGVLLTTLLPTAALLPLRLSASLSAPVPIAAVLEIDP